MKAKGFLLKFTLGMGILGVLLCTGALAKGDGEPKNISILQAWTGDYPVSQLERLPENQRATPVGYLGTSDVFADVWRAFKPGEETPAIDFSKYLVVFSRNLSFYNRTSIVKVILKEGVAEILAIETLSANPIQDKVAMAMAVIPREGVKFIQAGNKRIAVASLAPSAGPMNESFTIEGRKIRLVDGYHQEQVAPGSAEKIKTIAFGKAVTGDLDGDGDEDAAFLLLQTSGGSGTFYYAAAAVHRDRGYSGTNGVFLGDRISPQNIQIRNGIVVVNYADRRPDEPMAAPPSVGKTKYLTLKNGQLEEIKLPGEEEQIFEGWVTIGHEVRSFQTCSAQENLWIRGDSPALSEIIAAHRLALSDRKRDALLFMVLAGKHAERPADGFGKEYEKALLATQLIKTWPQGNCRSEYIVLESPAPGAVIKSPLRMRGQARGIWFFEGNFPLLVKDSRGKVIGKGIARARGEWMTEKFVPFEGLLKFKTPKDSGKGTLVLKKDNPTDRRELDDSVEIPVFFK